MILNQAIINPTFRLSRDQIQWICPEVARVEILDNSSEARPVGSNVQRIEQLWMVEEEEQFMNLVPAAFDACSPLNTSLR